MVDQDDKYPVVVLVVEDEAVLRHELVEAFGFFEFRVLAAETAAEALTILQEHAPEIRIVFTDIRLPGSMDGLMLSRHIEQNWPSMPLLVTSGHGSPEASEMPSYARFVSKPYRINKVVGQIKDLVAGAASRATA